MSSNESNQRDVSALYFNAVLATIGGAFLLLISNWIYTEGFWHYFSHEAGFALLVAVVIWLTFEIFLSARAEEDSEARIEKIAKSVFLGVFKRNFPEDYIREANSLVLEPNFVREDIEIVYTLSDAHYSDEMGARQAFVLVHTATTHRVRNVGNGDHDLPIAIGLPNPLIDELKAFCSVTYVHLKGENLDETPDLVQAEKRFREKLADDDSSVVHFDLGKRRIASASELELTFHYTMAKEPEDNEIFQTKLPAKGLSVSVIDRGPTERAIRARSLHAKELENRTPPNQLGSYFYRLDHWLLPRQGFTIWWKNVPSRASLRNPPPGSGQAT